jgi:hypothetical protein
MRFVYLGPPDEPDVAGTLHAMTGEWVTGEPREIADPGEIAWLSRHPHWSAVVDEAPAVETIEDSDAQDPGAVPARRGRPRKVV